MTKKYETTLLSAYESLKMHKKDYTSLRSDECDLLIAAVENEIKYTINNKPLTFEQVLELDKVFYINHENEKEHFIPIEKIEDLTIAELKTLFSQGEFYQYEVRK